MGKDTELAQVTETLIAGEIARVAAGGAEMKEIEVADLEAQLALYQAALTLQNNKKQALDTAQEALTALCNTARELIVVLWDEVESKYAIESRESQRANATLWGVVYKSTATEATINVLVHVAGDPLAVLEGATVRADEGDAEATTNEFGTAQLKTTFAGAEKVIVDLPGYVTQTIDLTVAAGGTYNLTVALAESGG